MTSVLDRQLATEQTTSKQEIKTILADEKVHLEEKLKTLNITEPENKTKLQPAAQEPNASEIKKRQEYLRQQRDKLVALKKEARKKQLHTETNEKPQVRPKSAKAAEKVLVEGETGKIDAQQLQIRKTLAERLRNKVVNNKD